MKIILSKDDVMEILCKKFDLSYIYDSEEKVMKLKYTEDEIYWEGNPDENIKYKEAAKGTGQ